MSKPISQLLVLVSLTFVASSVYAEDKIELDTIKIKGNKELPKILYVVPWQDTQADAEEVQKLKLHDFFGELYEPMTPTPPKTALEK